MKANGSGVVEKLMLGKTGTQVSLPMELKVIMLDYLLTGGKKVSGMIYMTVIFVGTKQMLELQKSPSSAVVILPM